MNNSFLRLWLGHSTILLIVSGMMLILRNKQFLLNKFLGISKEMSWLIFSELGGVTASTASTIFITKVSLGIVLCIATTLNRITRQRIVSL
jgi:hypothetical protein